MAAFQISRKVYVLAPRRVEHEPEEAPDGQATSGGAANQTMDDLIAEFGYPLERQTPVGSPSLYEALLPPRPSTPEDSPDSSPSPTKPGKTWAATAVSTPVDYSTDFSSPIPGPGGAYNEPVWIKEQPRSNKQLRRLKRNANLSKSFDMGNRSQSPDTTSTSSPLVSDIARRLAMSRSGRQLDRPALRPNMSVAYQEWQVEHMKKLQVQQKGASNGYSDKSLRCQLPLTVCQRILSFAMPEDLLSILSERQQRKAFEWGQLHDSLSTEYDWRTRDESSQIWMLLESIDCLEYD
ncbi:hypothetical protein BDZ85DRAFT_21076 [Elsinoe ampelina]|uniref:Uncharacterized protein n=1 Tax=Elsinoe ampelina TaxID=302913 RepID=A0A6A6G5P6_9PEZI|nr:hypothetical protein BDZ85DRAFT_21076 [Elsinoe ampelina]